MEVDVNYLFIKKEDFYFYAGGGVRILTLEGLVVPVGVNFYPLESKNFGFHIEMVGIFGDQDILRGSWGIRYRFD